MNLQDLTQAAAIVSSLAVVVSLIYASVQLRHSTRALMATTYNAVTSNSLASLSPMTGSPGFSEFLHRAHAQPDALMPAERMPFDAVVPTYSGIGTTFTASSAVARLIARCGTSTSAP